MDADQRPWNTDFDGLLQFRFWGIYRPLCVVDWVGYTQSTAMNLLLYVYVLTSCVRHLMNVIILVFGNAQSNVRR